MKTFTKISATSALAIAVAMLIGANSADAACPTIRIAPNHGHFHPGTLPKFGFSSRTIRGLGEEVVRVRHHSIAQEMGLEAGDLILDLNEFRLTHRGDWHEALCDAMDHHDGNVVLRVRDIRTGSIVYREICLNGPIGPITPKSQVVNRYSLPSTGPITLKSLGPQTLRSPSLRSPSLRSQSLRSQNGKLNNFSNRNLQLKSAPKNSVPQKSLQQQQLGNNFKDLSRLFKKD